MRTVGIVTTVLGATVAVIGVFIGVRAIPDIRRYLKIRRM